MMRSPARRTRVGAGAALALLLGASPAAACFVSDIDLTGRPCPCADGYTCVADICVPGSGTMASSSSGMGGATTSSTSSAPTMSSSTDASGSSSSGGMTFPLANPLVYESAPATGTLSLATEGAFRIQSTEATRWQWSAYYDLGNGDPDNLSSSFPGTQYQNTPLLFEPSYLTTDLMDWSSSQSATVLDIDVTDETPLRVLVETTLAYPFTGAEVYTATYTYASGRIATYVELYNTSAGDITFAAVEYNYVSVNPNLADGPAGWDAASWQDLGVGFFHASGPAPKSAVMFINTFGQTALHNDSDHTNWYWGDFGSVTIAPGDDIYADGELQLGPAGEPAASLPTRTDDALNPELEIMSGATPVDEGYNTYLAAYQIYADDGATSLVFGASAAHTRHAPAFEVYNFKPTAWRVMFRGQEVCSSAELVGHGCVAWQSGDHLAFALMLDIPAGTPAAERMVTLEASP